LTIARKDLGEGGLSGSVTTHQSNLVTLLDAKIHAGHQSPGTNLNFEVLNRYQSKSFLSGMNQQTEQPKSNPRPP
jgi:hypothetical protein